MDRAHRIAWTKRLVLTVVVVLVFGDTIDSPYHLDDYYRIVGNPELDRVWPLWRHFADPSTISTLPTIVQYRPLLPLTLSLTTWGSDVAGVERLVGHHIGNIAIHLVSVLLVSRLVTTLMERLSTRVPAGRIGFFAALLFAVHPVSGVPVTYLCARDLLLMQAFLLGSLIVFARIRSEGSTRWRWSGALSLIALSLASKTDAVVAPGLVFVLDVTVFAAPILAWRTWGRALAFAAPVLGFFALTELVLGFSDAGQLLVDRGILEYPLTQAELHVFYYLRNFIWPFHMRVLPEVEPATGLADPGALVGLAFLAVTLGVAWRLRRRAPWVAACIGCYWIGFAPTSWFLPFRYLATDYRQYPSLPWICALLAYGVLTLVPRREALAALVLVATYFGASTIMQGRLWSDPTRLWGHSVRHGGEAQAHVNYGLAVSKQDPALAEAHFHEALRRAPHNIFAMINLGMLEITQGRLDAGITRLEQAHQSAPGWPITAQWLDKGCQAALLRARATLSASMQRCRARLKRADDR